MALRRALHIHTSKQAAETPSLDRTGISFSLLFNRSVSAWWLMYGATGPGVRGPSASLVPCLCSLLFPLLLPHRTLHAPLYPICPSPLSHPQPLLYLHMNESPPPLSLLSSLSNLPAWLAGAALLSRSLGRTLGLLVGRRAGQVVLALGPQGRRGRALGTEVAVQQLLQSINTKKEGSE